MPAAWRPWPRDPENTFPRPVTPSTSAGRSGQARANGGPLPRDELAGPPDAEETAARGPAAEPLPRPPPRCRIPPPPALPETGRVGTRAGPLRGPRPHRVCLLPDRHSALRPDGDAGRQRHRGGDRGPRGAGGPLRLRR